MTQNSNNEKRSFLWKSKLGAQQEMQKKEIEQTVITAKIQTSNNHFYVSQRTR